MRYIALILGLMISLIGCKKHAADDDPVADAFAHQKKYVIYNTKKLKTNNGNDCPSRQKGKCVCLAEKDYKPVADEIVVGLCKYCDAAVFLSVSDDFEGDSYVVDEDWIIWDKIVLENLQVQKPIIVKEGRYPLIKGRESRYAIMYFDYVLLKEDVVVFMEEKVWRSECFYDGFLGECDVLTGVVESKTENSLTLLMPYENNVLEGEDRLMEIVRDGEMVVDENVNVSGLGVTVKKGEYKIEEAGDGVHVKVDVE